MNKYLDTIKSFDQAIPLFICGFPKSGTTLALSLLDSHSELLVMPEETRFFGDILPQLRKRVARSEILKFIYEQTGIKHFRIGASESRDIGLVDYPQINFEQYKEKFECYWQAYDYSEAGLLKSLLLAYKDLSGQSEKPPYRYWVEKTPLNELYVDKILKLFPNAYFVYVLRDPRANFYSYSKTLTKRIDSSFNLYTFLIDWSNSLLRAVHFQRQLNQTNSANRNQASRFILMVYEDLVNHPQEKMQNLMSQLDCAWDDALLRPTRASINWQGNSMHGFQFDQISSQTVSIWQNKLPKTVIHQIESFIGKKIFNMFGWRVCENINDHPNRFQHLLQNILLADKMPWLRRLSFVKNMVQIRTVIQPKLI